MADEPMVLSYAGRHAADHAFIVDHSDASLTITEYTARQGPRLVHVLCGFLLLAFMLLIAVRCGLGATMEGHLNWWAILLMLVFPLPVIVIAMVMLVNEVSRSGRVFAIRLRDSAVEIERPILWFSRSKVPVARVKAIRVRHSGTNLKNLTRLQRVYLVRRLRPDIAVSTDRPKVEAGWLADVLSQELGVPIKHSRFFI